MQASLTKLTDSDVYNRTCKDALQNWRGLGNVAAQARRTLLRKAPGELTDGYLPISYQYPDQYVEKYWKDFTLEGLRLLADAASQQVGAAVDQLRALAKFPLTKLSSDKQVMSPADVDTARKMASDIFGAAEAYEAKTIGAGALTNDRQIDDQVKRLRGLPGDAATQNWLASVRLVLEALPPAGASYACGVSIPSLDVRKQTTWDRWTRVELKQGTGKIGKDLMQQAGENRFGDVRYPGDALAINLYRQPTDVTPERTVSLEGSYAAILLLQSNPAERMSDDGKRWHVEVKLKDPEGNDRSLWIQLDFEKGLPAMAQWAAGAGG